MAVKGLRMQDWWRASESVGRRIVESDARVASTGEDHQGGIPGLGRDAARWLAGDIGDHPHDRAGHEPPTRDGLVTGRQRSPEGRWFLDVRPP